MSGGHFDYMYAVHDALDVRLSTIEQVVVSLEQEATVGDAELVLPFAEALSAFADDLEASRARLNEKFNTFREVCKAHELYKSSDGCREDVIKALAAWKEKA